MLEIEKCVLANRSKYQAFGEQRYSITNDSRSCRDILFLNKFNFTAKTPVYSHVNSTISGLTTIRSAEAQEKIKAEFDSLQNVHTSAHYLNIVSSSAFGFYIDILSVSLLAFVVACFIIIKDSNTVPGMVGLAISQILMLYGSVQYGLRQTTEMMTQMISVERIFQFTSLEQEGPFETNVENVLPKDWPHKGEIKFDHLCLKYSDEDELVLKDIKLNIRPGEKVRYKTNFYEVVDFMMY